MPHSLRESSVDAHSVTPVSLLSKSRIAGLDGLRAISILPVLIGHGASSLPEPLQTSSLFPFFTNSYLGISTFFVLSGYLITLLLRQEYEATGKIRLSAFYLRRALRIFPAFYSYLLVVVVLRVSGYIATTYDDITLASLFLTNYAHCFSPATNSDYWYVGHFWTLSLEEQFYLLWPATVVAAGLIRSRRIATLLIIAAPLVRVATYFLWPEAKSRLVMMLHTGGDPIMMGCFVALWQGEARLKFVLDKFKGWQWTLVAALFVLILSRWLNMRFQGNYLMTVGITMNSLCIAFLLLRIVESPQSQLTRFLSTPLMVRVGILSYSLYLWQQLFLGTTGVARGFEFPLNFLACYLVAEFSFRFIELPFVRLRQRWRPAKGTTP